MIHKCGVMTVQKNESQLSRQDLEVTMPTDLLPVSYDG